MPIRPKKRIIRPHALPLSTPVHTRLKRLAQRRSEKLAAFGEHALTVGMSQIEAEKAATEPKQAKP